MTLAPPAKPLFPPLEGRSAGVLLHPTSLPGQTGIGTLGEKAYRWVDFLAEAGVKYWQMLPVGPTGDSGAPYMSLSSCAGNPYLIDLPTLVAFGLLEKKDLEALNGVGDTKVDFAAQHALRFKILEKAYRAWKKKHGWKEYGSFENFQKTQADWLRPYALFMALKNANGEKAWNEWPVEHRRADNARQLPINGALAEAIEIQEFFQYCFWGQWQKLRGYAVSRGVRLIGDVPIYVPQDSVDVWANPEMFLLDAEGKPTCVGGCPPDYFDKNGQRWGNPIYDWPVHQQTKYRWWMKRFGRTFELFDVVRIDHFRAFYDFWKIPASSPTAQKGEWVLGPGIEFFQALEAFVPHARMIAEDMGDLNQGVKDLLAATGLPGLTALQFAFGGDAGNPYLPHNAKQNQVAYTGTHDNDTLAGWIEAAKEHERGHALAYLNCHKGVFVEAAIKETLATVSSMAIVPAQDLLGLGTWARMNTPGTPIGNWNWRMSEDEFARLDAKWLREQLRLYGRV